MLFDTKNAKLILASVALLGSSVSAVKIPDGVRNAAEAQMKKILDLEEECVDKHDIKVQCKEWAWFGEWYVDSVCR